MIRDYSALKVLCEGVIMQDASTSSSATSSSSQPPEMQFNAVEVKAVPRTQSSKTARTHAEQLMKGYRPGGVASDNRNALPSPNPQEEQKDIIAFFMAFLRKANEIQIRVFKAVMDSPTAQTIQALLQIPFIPRMIREERERLAAEWAKKSDREFCYEMAQRYKTTFYQCLIDYNKDKLEKQKKDAQSMGSTQ